MGIFLISGNDGSVPKARIRFCLCDESDNCESFVGEILFCGCCLLCEIGTLRGEIGPIERKGSVGSLKRLTRISVAPAAISGARPFGFYPRILLRSCFPSLFLPRNGLRLWTHRSPSCPWTPATPGLSGNNAITMFRLASMATITLMPPPYLLPGPKIGWTGIKSQVTL